MRRVYLDHNATTPPHEDVLAAMAEADRSAWANPSSTHADGRAARRVLDDARVAVGSLVGVCDRDVILTGSGTEANNIALRSAFPGSRGTLVTSRLEHPSVVATAEALAAEGVEVRWLPVPPSARLDPDDVARALCGAAGPLLLAVHWAHHETGVLQDVDALAAAAQTAGARLHVDLVQSAGRVAGTVPFDSASIAAHKLRGPKGIGALVVRAGLVVRPVLRGGAQERGLRPGTQSASLAAGLGAAARRAEGSPARYEALRPSRDRLLAHLASLGAVRTTVAPATPHVAHVLFPGRRADELTAALDVEGVAASAGPACAAGTAEPSPAVVAMLGAERARSAVRFSLGETTSEDDVTYACAALGRVLARPSRNA